VLLVALAITGRIDSGALQFGCSDCGRQSVMTADRRGHHALAPCLVAWPDLRVIPPTVITL